MIEIFVRVEKCIRKALVKIGSFTTITNAEIKIFYDLIDVLEPVKHAARGRWTLQEERYSSYS